MKNDINKGHYLELKNKKHKVMMNIKDHLIDQTLAENKKDIQKKIEKAQHKLWEAYQLVGNKEYENEKLENNAHK